MRPGRGKKASGGRTAADEKSGRPLFFLFTGGITKQERISDGL
jgi:hypothetical protein